MDEFVERLAGIGVPAFVFLIIMSTTGLAGAAAITATLALLGPGGMIGSIITLTVIVRNCQMLWMKNPEICLGCFLRFYQKRRHAQRLPHKRLCDRMS